jgi:nitrite reductase (cytochrome c-552)
MAQNASPAAVRPETPAWRGWALLIAAMVATFLLGLLAASVLKRREEARQQRPMVPIADDETDSSKWGINFPRQYETYLEMREDTSRTKYGGSYPRDYLEITPVIAVLYGGYPFEEDFRQARGHVYSLEDVLATKRITDKSPATCMSCKSPDVVRLMGDKPEDFYAKSFSEVRQQIKHPIGCADCHTPNTMQLRITRPALREAFKAMGRDIDQVSHQEMRSLVCAQCHVEYYFKGEGRYLTFPWSKGTTADQIEEYYDEIDFSDWTHSVSKAKMLKMQHPDYEVYSTGIHAYRNVACADCHMPYRTEGGTKFTNHRIHSPLLDIANSCAVCHRWSEDEIRDRVYSIQDSVREGLDRSEAAIAHAHFDIAAAMQAGAADEQLARPRQLVRSAQMRWDYVSSHNGMGFHSPLECMRTLTASVDQAGEARIETAKILVERGVTGAVVYPDVSTKEKARAVLQQFRAGNPPKLLPDAADPK